jgi:hypothetical protein
VKQGVETLCEKIDKHNDRTEESHRNTMRDMAANMADDLYKPLRQMFDGETEYKPYFGSNVSTKHAKSYRYDRELGKVVRFR